MTNNKNKIKWPERVPILDASDMCKGNYDGPNDTQTKEKSAKLWNEVMTELGYVVPCKRK